MTSVPAQELPRLPVYKVIYDKAYAPALGFAAQMRRQGVATHSIDKDITSVWFNDLALRWRRRPVAIAGLTAATALFCLEQLAWDHRMRVVLRATHTERPDGDIEHRIRAPQALMPHIEKSLDIEPDWAASMADLALHCPPPGVSAATELTVGKRACSSTHAQQLVSWVIAPVNSALQSSK